MKLSLPLSFHSSQVPPLTEFTSVLQSFHHRVSSSWRRNVTILHHPAMHGDDWWRKVFTRNIAQGVTIISKSFSWRRNFGDTVALAVVISASFSDIRHLSAVRGCIESSTVRWNADELGRSDVDQLDSSSQTLWPGHVDSLSRWPACASATPRAMRLTPRARSSTRNRHFHWGKLNPFLIS